MILDRATTLANKERFVARAIANRHVLHLLSEEGVANSVSNDDEEHVVLMFWSNEAYARRVQSNGFEDFEVREISLFDFLYRWLPGMSDDHVLAGVNWTKDLIGLECDPYELRVEIESKMSKGMLEEFEEKYRQEQHDV